MKRFFRAALAVSLCLGLAASPALAHGGEHGFRHIHDYPGFHDVSGRWSESYVRACYEVGLMEGTGNGFAPQASLTQGEVAALAARIHCTLHAAEYPAPTEPWYQGAVDYLAGIGIAVEAPRANATRESFFALLAAVVPQEELTPINRISALPDTSDPAVLAFYNAGILTGVDPFGTFQGDAPLSREECAAMCARIADPSLRRWFTPAGQVAAGALAAQTVLLTIDGAQVSYGEYEDLLLSLARELQEMYLENGLVFSWEGKYGEDWDTYFPSATLHSLTARYVTAQKARELGCTQEELAGTLFGPPSAQDLEAAANTYGLNLADPGQAELAAELALEEKLNAQLSIWIEESTVVLTEEYRGLDPLAICRDRLA